MKRIYPILKIIALMLLLPLTSYLALKDRKEKGVEPNGFIASECLSASGLIIEKIDSNPKDQNVITLQASTTLNNAISSFLSSLDTKQSDYIQTEGKYFQGLDSSKGGKPHYQTKNYSDLGIDTNQPFIVKINQYKTPDGVCGWQATVSIIVDKNRYSKSIGKGPNASIYGYDWQKDEKPY